MRAWRSAQRVGSAGRVTHSDRLPAGWGRELPAVCVRGMVLCALALTALMPPSRSSAQDVSAAAESSSRVLLVPTDYPTIQSAVDAASAGDLVLIAAGAYRERVQIDQDSVVVRGADRDSVIINGEFTRDTGVEVTARGVAIEQLTFRDHLVAGVRFAGARAFRVSAVAASNTGAYGLAVTATSDGVIEDSYVSGAAEAGVLVADCGPCRIAVRRVTGEHNAIGLLVRDAGGDILVAESRWRMNRAGMVLLSTGREDENSQYGAVVTANLVSGNHSRTAPGSAASAFAWGNGIVVAGGRENRIENNAFAFHAGHGVLVAPIGEGRVRGNDNRIGANRFEKSGRGDVGLGGPSARGNCIEPTPDLPRSAPHFATCGSLLGRLGAQDLVPMVLTEIRRKRVEGETYPDWRDQPLPAELPAVPAPETWSVPDDGDFALQQDSFVLPAEADSLLAGARARPGPPIHVSVRGLQLAAIQAWLPLTPAGIVGLLFAAFGALFARRRADRSTRAATLLGGGGVLAVAILLAWLGLALLVSLLLSSI